jgi:hypothetical protein
VHTFHIEAGDAALTLNEFSHQSSLQLLFDYNIVRGRKTQAVSGEYEAPAARAQMLADTGLVFDFVNERTLPQTFGGGPTEDTHFISAETQTNSGLGSGINLRGLGALRSY